MARVKTVGEVVSVSNEAIVIQVTHDAYASWSRSVNVVARKRFQEAWRENYTRLGLGSRVLMSAEYGYATHGDECLSRLTFTLTA